jgi:hypothetical protein
MAIIRSKVTINQSAINLINSLPDKILNEIYPKVVNRVAGPIKASIISKLPDGEASGTRKKQSKTTKARFPNHMRENVGRKTIHDSLGTLILIGVTREAAHVNFDHGEKAKTEGRLHKLWWVKGAHEKFATPALRKQTVDIPKQVRAEFEGTISKTFVEEIKRLRLLG